MTGVAKRLAVTAEDQISWARFAGDVAALAEHIGGHENVCNLFASRYAFTVGLAAALAAGVRTVLPPSRAPEAIAATIDPGTLVLGAADTPVPDGATRVECWQVTAPGDPDELRSRLARADAEIHVFTSGSTGRPQRHVKTWKMLANGAAATSLLLEHLTDTGAHALLGTTPAQHMYGLEATVFTALAHDRTMLDMPVFYPADLEAAIDRAGAAGIETISLITSPAHLRFLAPVICARDQVSAVISATAPMPDGLARQLEDAGRPVYEVYGATECGSIATRRTIAGPAWSLAAGFSLNTGVTPPVVTGTQLPAPVPLGDLVNLLEDGRFSLAGRVGDTVSIAGKRQSLGALNALVADAPGLSDGVILRERCGDEDVLGAVLVADHTSGDEAACRAALRAYLAERIDPVFIPKRIAFTNRLPRGETGKLTETALRSLAALLGRNDRSA